MHWTVGPGVKALTASRHFAQVLGLESQPEAPHTQGSHHGLTRITRLAYAEHPSYVPILRRSFVLWKQLEQETGRVRVCWMRGGVLSV